MGLGCGRRYILHWKFNVENENSEKKSLKARSGSSLGAFMQLQYLRSHFGAVKGQYRGRFMRRGAGGVYRGAGGNFLATARFVFPAGCKADLPHGGKLQKYERTTGTKCLFFEPRSIS